MTRKDFQLIADTIKGCAIASVDRKLMAHDFAWALRGTNSNFDRQRFLRACGVEA